DHAALRERALDRMIEGEQPVIRARAAVAERGDVLAVIVRKPDISDRFGRERRAERIPVPPRAEPRERSIARGEQRDRLPHGRREVQLAHPTTVIVTRRWCGALRCSHTYRPCQVPSSSRPAAIGIAIEVCVSTERTCAGMS